MGVLAVLALVGGGVAQAQGSPPSITLTIDPTSGPGGTVIDASGQCFENEEGGACDDVQLSLLDPDSEVVDFFIVGTENQPDYAGGLTVPGGAVCGDYTVLAEGIENDVVIVSTTATFEVPGCVTTTTSASTTTEPATSTTAPAAVAPAVASQPTFTG